MRTIDRSRKPVGQAMKLMDQHPALPILIPAEHTEPAVVGKGEAGAGRYTATFSNGRTLDTVCTVGVCLSPFRPPGP